MCTVLLPPGVNPIAVNKCININEIEKNKKGEARSTYGGGERLCRVLVGKPEGKRPLGRQA
jgi:hypothetical protein